LPLLQVSGVVERIPKIIVEGRGGQLQNDVTGKDEAVIAEALVLAAANRLACPIPYALRAAPTSPLALYIAVKYLATLSENDETRLHEHAMKAILVGRYPEFVQAALALDPDPPNLIPPSV
jgi:hypothetical protein